MQVVRLNTDLVFAVRVRLPLEIDLQTPNALVRERVHGIVFFRRVIGTRRQCAETEDVLTLVRVNGYWQIVDLEARFNPLTLLRVVRYQLRRVDTDELGAHFDRTLVDREIRVRNRRAVRVDLLRSVRVRD